MIVRLNEYEQIMVEVAATIHHKPELISRIGKYIVNLEKQKKTAQAQYLDTLEKLRETDYELQNEKKENQHNRTALEGFVKENQALRTLVSLWS